MATHHADLEPDPAFVPTSENDVQRMASLIEALSAYIEYYHGGSLELVDFDGETLRIRMAGACIGCELAPVTLHGWVEGAVRPFFPKLKQVLSV